MIAWLHGKLRAKGDGGRLIVDVGGVGYAVQVPIGVAGLTPIGGDVTLHIHTQVREDILALFGFEDEAQLATFHALTAISKVGPKLAMAVIGGIAPPELAAIVEQGDMARLTQISGVGKRLAERLIVELRGKLDAVATGEAGQTSPSADPADARKYKDLRSALGNLQYRPKEIESVFATLRQELPGAAFDLLLRRALALLKK